MTDKQIIIDGVDVSGCSCHYNGWSQLYRDIRDMCDKGYDLECKPKENGCYHYTKCLEEQLKRKEQECDELKNLNTRLDNQRETYWKEYQKLKQTLIEIKKIIHFNKTNRLSGGACISVEQILQKISEVMPDEQV